MISKILILLATFAVVLCAWRDAIPVIGEGVNVVAYDVYTDETTGISHSAYCSQAAAGRAGKQELGYVTIDKANKIEKKPIPIEFGCSSVKIVSNGKAPFPLIVVEGMRTPNSEACGKAKTNGCLDLYIISSKDGNEWTKSRIGRRKLDDAIERTSPHLSASGTGRVYLFYVQKYCTDRLGRLAFVTRAPGSDSFLSEQVLNYPVDKYIIDILTTGAAQADETIHIFIVDNQKTLDISSKGLVKWNSKVVEDSTEEFSRVVSKKLDTQTVLIGIVKDAKKSYYKISKDNGDTWGNNVDLDEDSHDISTVETLIDHNGNVMKVLIAKLKSTDLVYKYVLMDRGSIITESELPFDNLEIITTSSLNLLKSKGASNQDILGAFAIIMKKAAAFPTLYYASVDIE